MTDGNDQIAALLARAARHARDVVARLDHQSVMLRLPDDARLSDRQRALILHILTGLIDHFEVAIAHRLLTRAELADQPAAGLVDAAGRLAGLATADPRPSLQLLSDIALLKVLKRRAEEHRMTMKVAERAEIVPAGDVVGRLVRSPDPDLSRLTMEMLIADSRRRDRFQEPLLALSELPTGAYRRLVWWTAAMLRDHLLAQSDLSATTVDIAIDEAVSDVLQAPLADPDPMARAVKVALKLDELGALGDPLLLDCLRSSRMLLLVATLSVRARVDPALVWGLLVEPGIDAMAILLRGIAMGRRHALMLLAEIDGLREGDVGQNAPHLAQIAELYDSLPAGEVDRQLAHWRLNPDFRDALDRRIAA